MCVVFRVVHQHDGEGRARPITVAFLLPYAAELRNHPPVARHLRALRLLHHLAALHRHQNIAHAEKSELDAGKQAGVASVDQRLLQYRQRAHGVLRKVEHPGKWFGMAGIGCR